MKKLFTAALVVSLFAFAGTSTVQAQSTKESFNVHKLEGLAMASYRQTCNNVKGRVNVEFQGYKRGHYSRFIIRESNHAKAKIVAYSRLYKNYEINEIKNPSDIVLKCLAIKH